MIHLKSIVISWGIIVCLTKFHFLKVQMMEMVDVNKLNDNRVKMIKNTDEILNISISFWLFDFYKNSDTLLMILPFNLLQMTPQIW